MARATKPDVERASTLDKLDIRLGRVVEIDEAPGAPKPAYLLTIDFGQLGRRVSVGRFTKTPRDELLGQQVAGILNFEPRKIGDTESQVLVLGVQYPKAESQEATPLVPLRTQAVIGEPAPEPKPLVDKQETFDGLEIRIGRVLSVGDVSAASDPDSELEIDFGKFGGRSSMARLAPTLRDELVGRLVLGILNLQPGPGEKVSQAHVLVVPVSDAASDEATPLVPLHPQPKIGGKLF